MSVRRKIGSDTWVSPENHQLEKELTHSQNVRDQQIWDLTQQNSRLMGDVTWSHRWIEVLRTELLSLIEQIEEGAADKQSAERARHKLRLNEASEKVRRLLANPQPETVEL